MSGLGSARVRAFVATREPEAARAFYHDALGLRLIADEQSALVFDANGTQLRIQKVRDQTPFAYTVLGWAVPDIQGALADLAAKGVSFERYESLPADASGVWTAPNGTKVAWFKDPDGNLLSLTEFGAGKPRPPLRRVR